LTSPQQRKGDHAERELIRLLDDLGVKVRRTRLSPEDHGDLSGLAETTIQVKSYKDVARAVNDAVREVGEQKERAGTTWGVGAVRRPGGRWVICMTVEDFVSLHREATA
jgi:Holliday junction resolvase